MRTLLRGLMFMVALAGLTVPSIAQITVTAGDVEAKLTVGEDNVTMTDTITTSVNIGSRGSTSWDFSGLVNHTSTTMTSVTPSSTPFISQFPGTTHVLKTSLAGSFSGIPGTVVGDLYTYLILGTNLVNPGSMGSGTIRLPGFNPVPGALTILDTPPDITYSLPFTLGTRWGSTYTETTVVTLAGFVFSRSVKNHILSYFVDAYGPMTMPDSSIHDALRIREEDLSGNPIVSYSFIAKDGATVQVTAADPSLPDSGTIAVARKYVTWSPSRALLPITLVGFQASGVDAHSVHLDWSTISEIDNYGFEVERAAQSSGSFQKISTLIPGHGTTNVPRQYSFVDNSPLNGRGYYRLKQIDLDQSVHYSEAIEVQMEGMVTASVPKQFVLFQNYPNPFNPVTNIQFSIVNRQLTIVKVFDILGREVATMVNEVKQPGTYTVQFEGSNLASGVYSYRIQAGSFVQTRKLLLLK